MRLSKIFDAVGVFEKSAKRTNIIASGETRREREKHFPTLKASNGIGAVRPFQGRRGAAASSVGFHPTLLYSSLSATKSTILSKILLCLLVLCLAVQFSGCSSISNLFNLGNSSESETKNNPEQLENQRREKQQEISKLKSDLGQQQKNAETEKNKYEQMKKETLDAKKDPNNSKEAPKTVEQRQIAKTADEQANRMKDSLTKAEQELKEIEGQLSKSGIADSPKNNLSWITWLLLGFAGLAGLVSIGLTYRILNGRINQERETNKHGYRMAEKRSQELNHRIEQLEKTAKLQSGQLTQFQTAIQSLQRQATERGGQNFQPQTFNEPPIFKPEPQFPVAAEDYLNKNRSNALTAAVDHYTNKLVQDANKGDEFLIVKDNGLANDLLYAVPNVARFSTKGDYLTYYQNYYACENPSGGAVWIKSPTTVRRVDGGWQLEEMGELEIK